MDEWQDLVGFIFVICVVVLIVGGIVAILSESICNAQTMDMGMPHRWSVMGGCQVRTTESQWIPLQNYRYMGDK